MEKFEAEQADQVPRPPAPEPGIPPVEIPPLPPQPDIPVPDPASPPIENPGDIPLPPITDPDAEPYVSVPPALIITDSNGATWTLGFKYVENRGIRIRNHAGVMGRIPQNDHHPARA